MKYAKILALTYALVTCFSAIQMVASLGDNNNAALIETSFSSQVGYLLDEIPPHALREAKKYIKKEVSDNQWLVRAKLQILSTEYRQVFRTYYFAPLLQLTLPPEQVWNITFTSKPKEVTVQNHAYIVRDYSFYSVLIGTANSINKSEPLLDRVDGLYTDTFVVPVDPEHVFQRTGYACADESSFSLDTVTSENFLTYFDQECGVEPYIPIENRTLATNLNCHWTKFPNVTCLQALEQKVGSKSVVITWKRIAWDESVAKQFRLESGINVF